MMGPAQRRENKLFYVGITLDARVPEDHPLRRIAETVDFNFARREVADLYGARGNPSVDPAVLLKLMLLLHLEDVPSERQLMRELPLRLDWLWFCGYDLDDTIPNHSVISKARRRWGVETFERLFADVLDACLAAGLIDGEVLHVDASVVRADADISKMRPALRRVAHTMYERLDSDAEPPDEAPPEPPSDAPIVENATDPEARMTTIRGKTTLGYKTHRVVDDACQIITAVATTHAAVAEGELLAPLLDAHEQATGGAVDAVTADKAYGTAANYRLLRERGATPCIPHRQAAAPKRYFGPKNFRYNREADCLICPAGETLRRIGEDVAKRRTRYQASAATCASCRLRSRCTDSKHGRRVGRLWDQDEVDWADGCYTSAERRHLMRRRQSCVEGSFADAANHHGLKRARWRGLMKVRIQNLLIAAAQNLRKLLKATRRRRALSASAARHGISVLPTFFGAHSLFQRPFVSAARLTSSSMAIYLPS